MRQSRTSGSVGAAGEQSPAATQPVERDLSGLRVLLVDDVMTTGTTLTVLAREVRKAGAAWVGAVALARA